MEQRLAQLVFDYMKNNRNIDDEFLNKATSIILSFNIYSPIDKIDSSIWCKYPAHYNQYFNNICINYQHIKQYGKKFLKQNSIKLNDLSSYKYIYFINTLLHEFEHAKQNNKHLPPFSIEELILNEETKPMDCLLNKIQSNSIGVTKGISEMITLRKTYMDLYEFCPSERLADINASEISSKIATELNDKKVSSIMHLKHYKTLLKGYNVGSIHNKSDIPTKHYLDSIGTNDKWNEILKLSENINSLDKMKLGLETNKNELEIISYKHHRLALELNK